MRFYATFTVREPVSPPENMGILSRIEETSKVKELGLLIDHRKGDGEDVGT